MAKIMLVEDDNNLREIYEARLQAEGYTLVSAKDGEEALVMIREVAPALVLAKTYTVSKAALVPSVVGSVTVLVSTSRPLTWILIASKSEPNAPSLVMTTISPDAGITLLPHANAATAIAPLAKRGRFMETIV